jgi:hypothetical protein
VTSNIILFILGLGLVPYAIAVIMPTWRWLLGVTLVIGGLLLTVWVQHWVASSSPGYKEGPGGGIGIAIFLLVTIGFAAGVAIRALTLVLRSRGVHFRYLFAIYVAGLPATVAIIVIPDAWHSWNMRAPSEACLNATLKIKVANANFAIPAMPIFNVYLGRSSRADAYYFNLNPDLRAFCGLGDNGRRPVRAANIWLRFGQYHESLPAICTAPVPDWAETYCAADGPPRRMRADEIDFPLDIHVFAPDEVVMGEFGGSRSTYEDSLHPEARPDAPLFIKAEALTPDQHPLTFGCREAGSGYWCKASYPWRNGATLDYSFHAGRDDTAARGVRIDVEARKFLSGFNARS